MNTVTTTYIRTTTQGSTGGRKKRPPVLSHSSSSSPSPLLPTKRRRGDEEESDDKKEYINWRLRCCFQITYIDLMAWVNYLKDNFLETIEEVAFYIELRDYRKKLLEYYLKNNFHDVFTVIKKIEEKIEQIKVFTVKRKEERRSDLLYILDKKIS